MVGDVYQHCKGGLYEILAENLNLRLDVSHYLALEDSNYRILNYEIRLESDKSEMFLVFDFAANEPFLIFKSPPAEIDIPEGLKFLVYHGLESSLTWVRSEPDFFSLHSSGVPRFSPI